MRWCIAAKLDRIPKMFAFKCSYAEVEWKTRREYKSIHLEIDHHGKSGAVIQDQSRAAQLIYILSECRLQQEAGERDQGRSFDHQCF